jgi:hypothetical protein
LAALHQLTDDELRLLGRLVGVLAEPTVVRTQRLELVDDEGRVRIVVGNLAPAEEDRYSPGVSLRSAEGDERITLALGDDGPALRFTLAGDDALLVGVDDPSPDTTTTGPYLELLGRSGRVALGWRVSDDGVAWEGQSPPSR